MTTEKEKLNRLINKQKPSGVNLTRLFYKRSPKSREGGKIYNMKIIQIFMNCLKIKDTATSIKTYSMLNKLINNHDFPSPKN